MAGGRLGPVLEREASRLYTKDEILKAMADMDVYRDWSSWPIPSEIDEMVDQLLAEVHDRDSYRALESTLGREHMEALGGFGWRACSWAVQRMSPELLRHGLVALALYGLNDPEASSALSLYGRSAYLIGVSRREVVEEAARIAGEPAASILEEYLRAVPLESEPVRGFREVRDGTGFRYEFLGYGAS